MDKALASQAWDRCKGRERELNSTELSSKLHTGISMHGALTSRLNTQIKQHMEGAEEVEGIHPQSPCKLYEPKITWLSNKSFKVGAVILGASNGWQCVRDI